MSAPFSPHAVVEIVQYKADAGGSFIKDKSGSKVPIRSDSFDTWKDQQLVRQLTVELTTDRASETLLRVFDPDYHFADRYVSDTGVLLQVARVWMGFGLNLGEPVFKGLLTRIERGDTDTSFRFYDMGYLMRRHQKTEHHREGSNVALIAKLARRNGLKFVPPEKHQPTPIHRSIIQHGITDWEFALERAEADGLLLFVRQDALFAVEPSSYRAPSLVLTNRQDFTLLRNFDLSYRMPENLKGSQSRVETRGRGRGGRRLKGLSSIKSRGTSALDFKRDIEIHNTNYANRRARAKKELHREHAYVGSIHLIPQVPSVRLDMRDTITLRGIGKLFSGNYLCDVTKHDLDGGSFTTEIQVCRDINK